MTRSPHCRPNRNSRPAEQAGRAALRRETRTRYGGTFPHRTRNSFGEKVDGESLASDPHRWPARKGPATTQPLRLSIPKGAGKDFPKKTLPGFAPSAVDPKHWVPPGFRHKGPARSRGSP